jgi:hypothetical protein
VDLGSKIAKSTGEIEIIVKFLTKTLSVGTTPAIIQFDVGARLKAIARSCVAFPQSKLSLLKR